MGRLPSPLPGRKDDELKRSLYVIGLLLIALAGMSCSARASLGLELISWVPIGPNTLFSYQIDTAAADVIRPGDFFRIYDFGGLVPGSITAPAGWTTTVGPTNPVPPPNVILTFGDDPTIPNITFTYNDASPLSGPTTLADFDALTSTYSGAFVIKDYVARVGTTAGLNADSVGANAVPPAGAPPAAVPEPGDFALLAGMAVSGILLVRGRRRSLRM